MYVIIILITNIGIAAVNRAKRVSIVIASVSSDIELFSFNIILFWAASIDLIDTPHKYHNLAKGPVESYTL